MRRFLAIALLAAPAIAVAQPRPDKPPAGDKDDAKALLASGLKLYAAKDYLSALAIFKNAYERFPSPKILLNIGTTLRALNRNAEAANVYQKYLDAPESEAAKKADVAKVLTELDAKVGTVLLTVTPSDAEVQINNEPWQPASTVASYRVEPGSITIKARRDGYEPAQVTSDAVAGKGAQLSINLKAIAVAQPEVAVVTKPEAVTDDVDTGPAEVAPSRFGAFAHALIDVVHAGGAARVGASFIVMPRLQVEAALLIGPSSGGYVGGRYTILDGMFRPNLAVGAPMFLSDGPRVALRGAAGLEVVVHRRLSVIAELGVERVLNAEMNYAETLFVPAIGAAGRL